MIIGAPDHDVIEYDEGKVYVYSILPGLTVATLMLPYGIAGFSYAETLTVYNGTPPYTWNLFSGSLPDGLELNPNGVINGIPTTVDTSFFTVEVTDAELATDTQDLSIAICQGAKGDVNCDGTINIFDVVRVVNIILGLPPPPTEYELWAGDCNEDDNVNILDVVCIVNLILDNSAMKQNKKK